MIKKMKCKKQMLLSIVIGLSLFFTNRSMADTAIVDTDTLKLREEASMDATVLELLNLGDKLEVIEQSGDWVKVKVKQMTGYVHKDYIKIEETEEETQEEEQNETTTQPSNTIEEEQKPEENNLPQQNIETEQFTVREAVLQSNSDVFILPLINATKLTQLNKDTKVTIMDEVNGWFYIQESNGNGWIRSNFVEQESQEQKPQEQKPQEQQPQEQQPEGEDQQQNTTTEQETPIDNKIMYVNYSSVYVRKGPSTEEESIDSLLLNAQVTVLAEVGDWYKVEVDGKTGYIAKRLLSSQEQEEVTSRSAEEREEQGINQTEEPTEGTSLSKGEEIVNYAQQFLGCAYVYGGAGPSSFDCSGFTMYIYEQFGIPLSHSASAQANVGTYVAREELKLGDLVFFKDYETMDGIGHCGIYIGDGNFIHASSGTGYCVKISTLLSGSYLDRYETARRVI